MLHSRGFATNENQAYAGQTRTPAASRSPHRRNVTTGRRPANHLLGQEGGSVAPKQLFGESSKTPGKPLGEKNSNKTPGPSRLGNSNGSPSKGAGASPLKNKASGSSNVLKSTNGKQRQQSTETPFGKAAMTPAPTKLGERAKTMSRQSSFVTPAANVGRAGQIKARMGEMMDAELGLSQPKAITGPEQMTAQPAPALTEEEMYPEIEYMPPSHMAYHPVFEFPDELDKLPRAKEVGRLLSSFSPFGIKRVGPEDLDRVEPSTIEVDEDGLDLRREADLGDSDDDPWPDVPIAKVEPKDRPVSASRPAASVARPAVRPTQSSLARAAAISGTQTSTPRSRVPTASTTQKPVPSRTSGLQRSIAASTTPARPRPGVKPVGSAARPGAKPAANAAPPKPKTMMNPALTDFVNDDLGKQAEEKIKSLNQDDELALCLDLGPPPEESS